MFRLRLAEESTKRPYECKHNVMSYTLQQKTRKVSGLQEMHTTDGRANSISFVHTGHLRTKKRSSMKYDTVWKHINKQPCSAITSKKTWYGILREISICVTLRHFKSILSYHDNNAFNTDYERARNTHSCPRHHTFADPGNLFAPCRHWRRTKIGLSARQQLTLRSTRLRMRITEEECEAEGSACGKLSSGTSVNGSANLLRSDLHFSFVTRIRPLRCVLGLRALFRPEMDAFMQGLG